MKIVCSPKGIANRERPAQGMEHIAKAGFENVMLDFSVWGEELLEQCAHNRLCPSIARMSYQSQEAKGAEAAEALLALAKKSLEVCGRAQCGYLVVPPLCAGIETGEAWEYNRDYYTQLAGIARENSVIILLKNQSRDLNGHKVRGICSDGAVAARWVDELNRATGEERFGFCMDVRVCSLCGQDMHAFVKALGNRLKAVVLCDCNGRDEGALLPFTAVSGSCAQTDWLCLVRGLRENGFAGQLVMDMSATGAAFSPLLRPALLTLAKQIADYFKWQIHMEAALQKYSSIVLFGAGNMCRNYMRCYGEQYPPLFTCDNNQKLWGTFLCGLEVKAPEALKDLPENCGVFICNIYYREIETQLREMDIENIEFFNDEYMPSFYFD